MPGNRIVVVSPHSDDGVLSLGASMACWARSGRRVELLTVLALDPDSTALSGGWDRRAGFATEGEAAHVRREEDRTACAHLGAEWCWHDEVYQFRDLRADARVLLRVRDGELDLAAARARPPSFGYPLAWCFEEEAGRVFSTSLGHFPAAWESPTYLRHLSGGMAWALEPHS